MLGEEEEGDVDDGGVVAVVCWLRIVFSRPCICNRLLRRLIAADMGGEGGGLAERSSMGNERGSRHPSPLSLRPLKFYVKRTKFNPRALNFCPKTGSLATSRGAGISYYALSGRRHHSYLYGPRQVRWTIDAAYYTIYIWLQLSPTVFLPRHANDSDAWSLDHCFTKYNACLLNYSPKLWQQTSLTNDPLPLSTSLTAASELASFLLKPFSASAAVSEKVRRPQHFRSGLSLR